MNNSVKRILVTGGAGFIGSHVIRRMVQNYPDYLLINVDVLTYAGNLENIADLESAPNYVFEKVDIRDKAELTDLFRKYDVTDVVHLAAESHVDRSISGPEEFVLTNVIGTVNLLECARAHWDGNMDGKVFYHISTDEVFGSLGEDGFFTETTSYDPQSPYSASKASSDHFVRAWHNTYGFPVKLSNCSNNYGPCQFPEKLIPLVINNIKEGKELPIYGKGLNIRDWLYVEDHAEAIDLIFHKGRLGESYNVGGLNEWKNIDLVRKLCDVVDEEMGSPKGSSQSLITFVKDRAGHDHRYAIDCTKIQQELGWTPRHNFEEGIRETVKWYLSNEAWLESVVSGEYKDYYKRVYQTMS